MAKKRTEESTDTIATTQVQVYASALPSTPARLENIRLELIRPSEKNPRKQYTDQAIMELADSISAQGLLQPITIRPIQGEMFKYEIVCGERRYRAVKYLMQETIPAIIREMTDAEAYDAVITENLQREDLDLIDEGVAYRLLVDAGQSVPELAARFGKSEKYIRGRMQLDALTDDLKRMLRMQLLPLTGAQMLSRLTPEKQDEFYNENFDENDEAMMRPVTVSRVENFVSLLFYSLGNALFLDDGREDWNIPPKPRLCEKCQFNTSAQLSFFPEMNKRAYCLNKDCFEEKMRRYAYNFIGRHDYHMLLPGQVPERETVALVDGGYAYTDFSKNLVKDLIETYQVQPVWVEL